jgi:hypothetical protein
MVKCDDCGMTLPAEGIQTILTSGRAIVVQDYDHRKQEFGEVTDRDLCLKCTIKWVAHLLEKAPKKSRS